MISTLAVLLILLENVSAAPVSSVGNTDVVMPHSTGKDCPRGASSDVSFFIGSTILPPRLGRGSEDSFFSFRRAGAG